MDHGTFGPILWIEEEQTTNAIQATECNWNGGGQAVRRQEVSSEELDSKSCPEIWVNRRSVIWYGSQFSDNVSNPKSIHLVHRQRKECPISQGPIQEPSAENHIPGNGGEAPSPPERGTFCWACWMLALFEASICTTCFKEFKKENVKELDG